MSTALPFESNVSSPRGAPMGRHSDPLESLKGKVRLRRVRFVDGDYDKGGAYWGGGMALWCAWNDEATCYFRVPAPAGRWFFTDREDAKKMLPGRTFYR